MWQRMVEGCKRHVVDTNTRKSKDTYDMGQEVQIEESCSGLVEPRPVPTLLVNFHLLGLELVQFPVDQSLWSKLAGSPSI